MSHPLSDPRVTDLPEEYCSSKKKAIALLLSDDGLASIPTWEERSWAWAEFRNRNLPKQCRVHQTLPYIIKYDTLSDGTAIFLKHPTRFGWTDFIWTLTKPFITVDGR